MVVAFLVSITLTWVSPEIAVHLAFESVEAMARPWTFLTYPLANADLLSVFFACHWAVSLGRMVEPELGTARFLGFAAIFAALLSACVYVGSLALSQPLYIRGAWPLLTGITVLWGTRHANSQVNLWGVLPVLAKWIAVASVALLLFSMPPLAAPFALIPIGLAWAFAADKLPIAYCGGSRRPKRNAIRGVGTVADDYFDKVKDREKEREEKERLRKLFESSLKED